MLGSSVHLGYGRREGTGGKGGKALIEGGIREKKDLQISRRKERRPPSNVVRQKLEKQTF